MSIPALIDHLFRRQSAQLVATLTRAMGGRHLALVEESVQDALVTALQVWPFRGVPADPAAWLYRVARNRVLDRLRHDRVADNKVSAVAETYERRTPGGDPEVRLAGEPPFVADDQLGMMFMTCHPLLPREMRVALTLKIVGGFSVGEIARAFLAQESTIAQRLVRAKRMLRERDIPFGPPGAADVAERLDSVLEVIYLTFNEGYAATAGDALLREDVSGEAIRLAGLVTRHEPSATPRAWALLALLLLHAARFKARVSSEGDLFLLRDQDRSRWDRGLIAEGLRALDRSAQGDTVSPYHLEAEIAACHAVAPAWHQTDWPRILGCYTALLDATQSPIVALNRAIARASVDSPDAAIADVDAISAHPAFDGYHLLPAVLAELWRAAGDPARAAGYYEQAIGLAGSAPERRFLAVRRTALDQ